MTELMVKSGLIWRKSGEIVPVQEADKIAQSNDRPGFVGTKIPDAETLVKIYDGKFITLNSELKIIFVA